MQSLKCTNSKQQQLYKVEQVWQWNNKESALPNGTLRPLDDSHRLKNENSLEEKAAIRVQWNGNASFCKVLNGIIVISEFVWQYEEE